MAQHCSRFISLGKVGNPEKKKYIYAFNVMPMKVMRKEELVTEPPNITPNPFTGSATLQQARLSDPESNHPQGLSGKTAGANQFFYDTNYTGERNNYRGRGRGGGRGKRGFEGDGRGGGHPAKRHQQGPPSACWFCLASPEVEKHLVVSIGDSVSLIMITFYNK
jgi:hypothetical protein